MNLYKTLCGTSIHYFNLDRITHFVEEGETIRVWFNESAMKDDSFELAKTTELLARLGIAIELEEPKPKVIKGEFKRTKVVKKN